MICMYISLHKKIVQKNINCRTGRVGALPTQKSRGKWHEKVILK